MVEIELPGGERAVVHDGVWTVVANAELTRVLNGASMQPPNHGYYAPTDDARKAEYVLQVWGGRWIATDQAWAAGKLY
jgi:hypothetical protein